MKALKEYREKNFMTQKDLADKVGLTQEAISRIETGKAKPRLKTLLKLAEVLNVSPHKLRGE